MRQDSLCWDDIKMFRKMWPGILMLKGINRPDDAVKALEYGVDGIIVSNHGGRNMDSAVASIDALPDIAEAVGDRATVLLDSGVRRGSDIAKALALGAKAVLTGRVTLYGTAVGGTEGASKAIGIIRSELDKTMAYTGCCSVDEISTDIFFADSPGNRLRDRVRLGRLRRRLMASLDRCYSMADLREAARRRLPRGVFEFVDRGSEDELAVRNNRDAFHRIKLMHRALVDVSGRTHGDDAVRQAGGAADGDRADRCRRPVLARGRAGAGEGRGEGGHSADAVDRLDDRDGKNRCTWRPGGRRAAVVPALCLEAARAVAPADRAGEEQRVRGADRDGGFRRSARTANTTRATVSACRSTRRCGLRWTSCATRCGRRACC